MRLELVTNWERTTSKIDTHYGKITHLEWCRRELERFKRHGDEVVLIHRTGRDHGNGTDCGHQECALAEKPGAKIDRLRRAWGIDAGRRFTTKEDQV